MALTGMASCISDEPWSFSLTRAAVEPFEGGSLDMGSNDVSVPNPLICLLAIPIGVDLLVLPVTFTLDLVDYVDEDPDAAEAEWLGEAGRTPLSW